MIYMYIWCRGESHSMVDFVVGNERLRRLVRDAKLMRGSEDEAGHYLIVSEMNLGEEWPNRLNVQIVCRNKLTEYLDHHREDCEMELGNTNAQGA